MNILSQEGAPVADVCMIFFFLSLGTLQFSECKSDNWGSGFTIKFS